MTQQAMLKALRYFQSFKGDNSKAWTLAIVRNCCRDWIAENAAARDAVEFDETTHSDTSEAPVEVSLLRSVNRAAVRRAIASLPTAHREVIVLREVHDLGYREIAEVTGTPIGTVMSRLARARNQLERELAKEMKQ